VTAQFRKKNPDAAVVKPDGIRLYLSDKKHNLYDACAAIAESE
jgi:hypothetical protein